jgi:hypothetical protein
VTGICLTSAEIEPLVILLSNKRKISQSILFLWDQANKPRGTQSNKHWGNSCRNCCNSMISSRDHCFPFKIIDHMVARVSPRSLLTKMFAPFFSIVIYSSNQANSSPHAQRERKLQLRGDTTFCQQYLSTVHTLYSGQNNLQLKESLLDLYLCISIHLLYLLWSLEHSQDHTILSTNVHQAISNKFLAMTMIMRLKQGSSTQQIWFQLLVEPFNGFNFQHKPNKDCLFVFNDDWLTKYWLFFIHIYCVFFHSTVMTAVTSLSLKMYV